MALKKSISLWSGVAIAISMVIGSGVFGLPGLVIAETSPQAAFLGWLLIIAIMPAMIYIFTHLGMRWPDVGGISAYATKGFGDWSAGGVSLLTCATFGVGMPAFFMMGGAYITELFALDSTQYLLLSALVLAFITTVINAIGLRFLSYVNKLSALFITLVLLITLAHNYAIFNTTAIVSLFPNAHSSLSFYSVWLASSLVFWAFLGWESMTFGLEEVHDPEKNIPKIFWYSFYAVSVLYLIFAAMFSLGALQGRQVTGLAGMAQLLPSGNFGKILLMLMVIVLLANANAWVFGASRAWMHAASDSVVPKCLMKTNRKGLPIVCLWFLLLIYSVVMGAIHYFHWSLTWAFMATNQGFIILYGGAILAFMRFFKEFKHRLIAMIAIISWLYMMSGFAWIMLYSLAFFVSGVGLSYVKRRA